MPQDTNWRKGLSGKLAGLMLAMLLLVFALIGANFYMLRGVQGSAEAQYLLGDGRWVNYRLLLLAERVAHGVEPDAGIFQEIDGLIARMERRFDSLTETGVTFPDPAILTGVRQRRELWQTGIRPNLQRVLQAATPEVEAPLAALRADIRQFVQDLDDDTRLMQLASERRVGRFANLQYGFVILTLVVLGLVVRSSNDIVGRAKALSSTADRIAAGELELRAAVSGEDELATLGAAFDSMTANLRRMIETERHGRVDLENLLRTISDTVNSLAAATSEILSSTTEQAAGVQEQVAAISQTVATVNQVLQTTDEASRRAKSVSESSQRAVDVGQAGQRAVEETLTVMRSVRERSESTAERILALAEQAQAIGEIIATVTDIAEQTNILALNAAIEASRAGEHGRGFSVVAGEVKALAEQSKRATAQVRQILGEIQKATNGAVIATEESSKSVGAAMKVAGQAGGTIKTLGDTLTEAARTASQIASTAGQQVAGISQIHQAMKNIDLVASQNLSSTRQTEQAAQDLNAVGKQLKELLAGYGR
jgi:methyl-accepting chemotaxis protein